MNRELYDWFVEHLPVPHRPRQYEFARLRLAYTLMSKRLLLALVQEGVVRGWDDPRMPTIAGLRRRGYTAASLRNFVERVGVAKAASLIEAVLLENAIREDLNDKAPRVMAVLDPIRLVIEDWPEDRVETLDAPSWPHDVARQGSRPVPFSRELWIERSDFAVEAPKGFKRLAPGRAIRLRSGYVVTCTGYELDGAGAVHAVRASHDPSTRGGTTPQGVKVWATIHWVAVRSALPVKVRLYEPLFTVPEPGVAGDPRSELNPDSLREITAWAEPSLASLPPGSHVQFERLGYFYAEPESSRLGAPSFNRVVSLKDTWNKAAATDAGASDAAPKAEKTAPSALKSLTDDGRALADRGVSEEEARVLESDPVLAAWFHAALAVHASPKAVAGWVVTELPRIAREHGGLSALPFAGAELGRLAALVESGSITHAIGKQVLAILAAEGGDPATIVKERGLAPISDPATLSAMIAEVVRQYPDKVAAFRGGRTGLSGFFVGQVMQRSAGRADASLVQSLVEVALKAE